MILNLVISFITSLKLLTKVLGIPSPKDDIDGSEVAHVFYVEDNIYRIIPDISLSQDIIAGFPTETEEDHQDTLSLLEYVKYDFGFMFAYSERPGTLAARKMEDDVPEEVKKRRLNEIIDLQQRIACRSVGRKRF